MSGRILTERLLATTSLAALLFAVGTPEAEATSCQVVGPGGSVNNSGSLPCVAVTTSSISVNNNPGATIGPAGSTAAVLVANTGTVTGGITNSGTIIGAAGGRSESAISVQGVVQGGITNGGMIAVSGTSTGIFGYAAPGIVVSSSSFNGNITNSGTVAVSSVGYSAADIVVSGSTFIGNIVNSGTLSLAAAPTGTFNYVAAAILVSSGSFTGNVINTGTIAGSIVFPQTTGRGENGLAGIALTAVHSGSASVFTGSVSNSGTISVSGVVNASSVGVFVAGIYSGYSTFIGGITNSGMIAASGAGGSANSVTVGGISVAGISFGNTTAGGSIINTGTINAGATISGHSACAQALGISVNVTTFSGGITNNGTIMAAASATNAGGFGASSATVRVAGIEAIASTFNGSIVNTGTIAASALVSSGSSAGAVAAGIVAGGLNFNGGISNAGTITVSAQLGANVGGAAAATGVTAHLVSLSGSVVNLGNIAVVATNPTGLASANGVSLTISTMSGSVVNSGSISAVASGESAQALGIGLFQGTFNGGVTNSGTITASAMVSGPTGFARATGILFCDCGPSSGGVLNTGTILATAQAHPSASAWGMSLNSRTMLGGVNNTGTIAAMANASGSHAFAGGIGIGVESSIVRFSDGSPSGGVTNSGSILASATQTAGSAVTAVGIDAQFRTFNSGINNSGTISASASANGGTANAVGVSLAGRVFNGVLANSGTIAATGSGTLAGDIARATGLSIAVRSFIGNISNSGTIIARAGDPLHCGQAIGIRVGTLNTFAGNIVNSGTIAGLVVAGTGNGTGVQVTNGGVTIVNSGVIEGSRFGIDASDESAASIIDQTGGTIAGLGGTGAAIQLSPSFADTVNISGGAINGNILGNNSNPTTGNIVNVNMGNGLFTYAGQILNVGVVNVNSGRLLLQNLTTSGIVTTNYTESAGATLALEVTPSADAASNHASVAAGGAVALASGAVLQAYEGAFAWTPGTYTYASVVTAGSTTGSFTATSNSPFFVASLAQSSTVDNLTLTMLQPNQVPGLNANQQSVASAIIGIPGGNSTLDQIFILPGAPDSTGLPTLGPALTQLSASQFTQTNYQPLVQAWQMFTDSLTDRLSQGDGYGGGVSASLDPSHGIQFAQADIPQVAQASDGGRGGPPSMPHRWGLWARGYGTSSTAPSTSTSAPYSDSGAGLIIGADNQITDRIVAGVALNVATDKATVTGGGFTQSNAYQGSVYGQYAVDPNWYVNGVAGFGWQNYKTARVVTLVATNVNNGSFDGQSYRLYGETGYALHPAFLPETRVTPYLGLGYLHAHTDGYSETGSATALNVQAMDPNSFATSLGARVATSLQIGTTVFRPELRAAWQHEWLDQSATLRATFAVAPGSPVFTATGAGFGRDSFLGGAGMTTTITSSTQIFVDYDAKVTGGYTAQAVSGGFRVQF